MMTETPGKKISRTPRYLVLGHILRPHGVQGELRMSVATDYPERVARLKTVYLSRDAVNPTAVKSYKLESVRPHQDYLLLKLAEIDDRDAADLLRDYTVLVDIASAVPLEEGEFYLYQLIDLTVKTPEGTILGKISDVFETGANDVYVVQSPEYGEILIPAHSETIVDINFETEVIIMNLPEGLLPS